MLIFQAIKCCFEISVLGSYAQDLRDKTDDEMHQYASPYRLGILVKISGYRTKNCSAKHHRKIVSHVKHEEEQSRDPYREMLVIFLAGSSDIILNDSLYEELLQNRADRIEPSHVGRKIKSEPRSLSDLGEKLVLYKTDDHKDDDESCAHDAADDKVLLDPLPAGIKALEVDLKSCEDCEKNRKDNKVSFHYPGKYICIGFDKRLPGNSRKYLDNNYLACNSCQKE